MTNLYLTLDVDWAPDFAIDAAADVLEAEGCRATWFVTHATPALERLRHSELFEVGVHPNFLPGSTHGEDPPAVLRHVLELAPEARCVRTHGAFQSGALIRLFARSQLELDCSVLLPGLEWSSVAGYRFGGGVLWRVPYFWSDDYEADLPEPVWELDGRFAPRGPKVLSFHPLHVALNSPDMKTYSEMKAGAPDVGGWNEGTLASARHPGDGAGTMFAALAERLGHEGGGDTLSALIPEQADA